MQPSARATPVPIIVVVEDDHDSRVLLRNLLEGEGYTVESAANGRVAVELLSSLPGVPKLVIGDLKRQAARGRMPQLGHDRGELTPSGHRTSAAAAPHHRSIRWYWASLSRALHLGSRRSAM